MISVSRIFSVICPLAVVLTVSGCMTWDYDYSEEMDSSASPGGLFIVCEGNFQYGNASLSYYNPSDGECEHEVFYRANGMKLGDVAQSMTMAEGLGWIVVNNSHVVFAIDPVTFRERGRIEGLTSPRYIHFLASDKAYVSQLWDNRITIVDPSTFSITGSITVPDMDTTTGSTEQMVQIGDYVYCNCWSYNSRIIRIDTATDRVDSQLNVGLQPQSIAVDRLKRLWVLTDGGYDPATGNSGVERPQLLRIDPQRMTIETRWELPAETARCLTATPDGSRLYWIAGDDVWSMETTSTALPVKPFLQGHGTRYYSLTVSAVTGDVYVADAIDYQQPGMIYRYSSGGRLMDSFYAGVTPGAFCWK